MLTPNFRAAFAGLAAFGILLLPASAAAQVNPGVAVELSANAGLYFPFNDLDDEGTESVSLDEDLGYGGTLGIGFPGGLALELQGLYVPATGLAIGGNESQDTKTNIFQLTGDVVYRFGLPLVDQVFIPFIGAGAGYRTLTFDVPGEGPNEFEDFTPNDNQASFVANALLGTYIVFSDPVWLRLEVRDYISSFDTLEGDSNLQNDLAVLAGLAFRFE